MTASHPERQFRNQSRVPGVRLPRHYLWQCHLPAVWLRASDLNFASVFLPVKWGCNFKPLGKTRPSCRNKKKTMSQCLKITKFISHSCFVSVLGHWGEALHIIVISGAFTFWNILEHFWLSHQRDIRALEVPAQTVRCSSMGIMCVSSTRSSLVRTSHMALMTCKRWENISFHMPKKWRQLDMAK